MKHAEHKSRRELAEAMMFRAFMKGLVCGALAGAGIAGIAMAAAFTFWMLT